jgi:signal transduction histidine kinase
MNSVLARVDGITEGRGRWLPSWAWLGGLVAYIAAILLAYDRVAVWINDIAWTVASAFAAWACLRTSRRVERPRRRAWMLLGLGCVSWLIGQLHWNYSELVLHVDVTFPSISQFFYSAFAPFAIAGVLQMPESREQAQFTFKHLGNIGLVTCCLIMTIVLGTLEPALQIGWPPLSLGIAATHTLLVAATFLTALYALWTYRWSASWMPMLLLVIATGVYAVVNLVYANSLLTSTYLAGDLINVSWLVMFGLISVAAHEQAWLSQHEQRELPQGILAHERWLEAVIPALLIIIMVAVAVGSSSTLSTRVVLSAAVVFTLFAVILGAREAWIQNESQQLTRKLVTTNEQLQSANVELRLSEARYRELATALEQRVSERTNELKRAYDELEGFSYAVAHDLKAPLRAINGFAHLFEAEMDGRLSPQAREHLARIRNGSLRMATLIDDLLAYSHIDRRGLQSSVVALQEIVDSVVLQYADEVQRRHVELSIQVEPLKLRIDAEGLLLALRNLFENALKYTRERNHPHIQVIARRNDMGIVLSVADNGIGFDMEYHDHIFKIFQRLHRDNQYPGTGIGLALVRKAVERIGGRVWAQSRPGEGATFNIQLPKSAMV